MVLERRRRKRKKGGRSGDGGKLGKKADGSDARFLSWKSEELRSLAEAVKTHGDRPHSWQKILRDQRYATLLDRLTTGGSGPTYTLSPCEFDRIMPNFSNLY